MLHVVFLILKILGILFLSILGLFLLLLCAALFVPVRYQLDMEKQEQVRVTVRAGWLFRFLFVKYELRWPEEEALWQNLCFRILGIPVFRPFRKKKKKREKGKPEPGKENNTDIGKNAGARSGTGTRDNSGIRGNFGRNPGTGSCSGKRAYSRAGETENFSMGEALPLLTKNGRPDERYRKFCPAFR